MSQSEILKKYSIENEQIVLSCLLQSNKNLYTHFSKIRSIYFINDRHKVIFEILSKMVIKKLKLNFDTFSEVAKKQDFGGIEYLEKLIDSYPDALENINYHIEQMALSYAKLRAYNQLLNDLDAILLDPKSEREEIEEIAESIKEEFKICGSRSKVKKGEELYNSYIDLVEARKEQTTFKSFGLPPLNQLLTEGAKLGSVTIVGASTSIGKTTCCMNMVSGLYEEYKVSKEKLIYFALEPQVNELLDMLSAMRLGITLDELIKDVEKLTDKDIDLIDEETYDLLCKEDIIHFYDDPTADLKTLEEILMSDNYSIAFIDLFEKFSDVEAGDWQSITVKLDEIQTIAKKTNTHIVIVQQLKQEVQTRKDHTPKISDLGSSKKYMEIADNIIFAHREKYYRKELLDDIMQLIVAKQRRGIIGTSISFKFEGQYARLGKVYDSKDVNGKQGF